MLRELLVLLSVLSAGCTHTKLVTVQPVGPEGVGAWAVLTDPDGDDHLLFCTARSLHGEESVKSGCWEMTPRGNGHVKPLGVHFPPDAVSGPR
jgi:hypothetical protein